MSLYGILCGESSNSKRLWKMLDLGKYEVGRYRNLSLVDGRIILLTRNGGGNREDHEDSFASLREHPNYMDDWDCNWDCTYAEIEFSIPEGFSDEIASMPADSDHGVQFDAVIESLKKL